LNSIFWKIYSFVFVSVFLSFWLILNFFILKIFFYICFSIIEFNFVFSYSYTKFQFWSQCVCVGGGNTPTPPPPPHPTPRSNIMNACVKIWFEEERTRVKESNKTYLAFQEKLGVRNQCLWLELQFVEFAWPPYLRVNLPTTIDANYTKKVRTFYHLASFDVLYVKRYSLCNKQLLLKKIPGDRSLVLQTQQQHRSP